MGPVRGEETEWRVWKIAPRRDGRLGMGWVRVRVRVRLGLGLGAGAG